MLPRSGHLFPLPQSRNSNAPAQIHDQIKSVFDDLIDFATLVEDKGSTRRETLRRLKSLQTV